MRVVAQPCRSVRWSLLGSSDRTTVADLEGAQPAPSPPPLGDGLTPSLTALLICDNGTVLWRHHRQFPVLLTVYLVLSWVACDSFSSSCSEDTRCWSCGTLGDSRRWLPLSMPRCRSRSRSRSRSRFDDGGWWSSMLSAVDVESTASSLRFNTHAAHGQQRYLSSCQCSRTAASI